MEETLNEPMNETISLEKANPWLRLVAFFIDAFIAGTVAGLIGSLFGRGVVSMQGGYSANVNGAPTILILIYFVVMNVKFGATLGKMVFKFKVVDVDTGENQTWLKAILREFVGRLVNGLTFGIGYLWMLWDKDSQGLHDKIGNSYVVKSQ